MTYLSFNAISASCGDRNRKMVRVLRTIVCFTILAVCVKLSEKGFNHKIFMHTI